MDVIILQTCCIDHAVCVCNVLQMCWMLHKPDWKGQLRHCVLLLPPSSLSSTALLTHFNLLLWKFGMNVHLSWVFFDRKRTKETRCNNKCSLFTWRMLIFQQTLMNVIFRVNCLTRLQHFLWHLSLIRYITT